MTVSTADYCCNCFVPSGWDLHRWPSYQEKACTLCKERRRQADEQQKGAAAEPVERDHAAHESDGGQSSKGGGEFEGDNVWQCEVRHFCGDFFLMLIVRRSE
jgi:hypothetical protein